MKYEVIVGYKPEVLDTTARAISTSLKRLGYESIKDLKVTKRFVIDFENDSPGNADTVKAIADSVLTNPVSETYEIHRI